MGATTIDMAAERKNAERQAETIRKYYAEHGERGVVVTVQLVPFGSQKTWSCRTVWPGHPGAAEVVA